VWYGISSSGCNMRRWTGHFLIAWGSWGIGIGISNVLVRLDGVLDLAILCDVLFSVRGTAACCMSP
jgi:hypothetical protein